MGIHTIIHDSSSHEITLDYDKISVTTSSNYLNISFTNITGMSLIGKTSSFFDYHYKAFLIVKFYDNSSNVIKTVGETKKWEYLKPKSSWISSGATENSSDFAQRSYIPSEPNYNKPSDSAYYSDYCYLKFIAGESNENEYLLAYRNGYEKSSASGGYYDADTGTYIYPSTGVHHDSWGNNSTDWLPSPIVVPNKNPKFSIAIPTGAVKAKVFIYGDSDPTFYRLDLGDGFTWHRSLSSCPCKPTGHIAHTRTELPDDYAVVVDPIFKPADIISVIDNGDNTVTITMPPFQNGTNNPVARQEGFIDFQRSCVYTGEYFDMGTSDFKYNDKATRLIKNNAGQYEKDLNILSTSEITADGKYYKNSDGTYTYYTGNDNAKATYRAIGYDKLLKRQCFPKTNGGAAADPSYERIGNSWDPGKSITFKLPIPFATLNINGKRLYGTTYVWVESGAIATDRTYLNDLVDGIYIKCTDANNASYFTNKSYSKDYFETGWKYYKESSGQYIAVKLSHTGKGTYYYISNKGQYGYDLRYCQYCEVTFNSYPRAPRNLWYETTHKNKTYTSSEDAAADNSKIYKENLRPRLKDTLTWCWDSGFGGLRSAKVPYGYSISIYRKSPDGIINVLNNSNSNNMIDVYANKYSIQPKELGFESGDFCGCKVIAFDNYEAKRITPENGIMTIYKSGKVTSDDVSLESRTLYGVTSDQYSYNYYKSAEATATVNQEAGLYDMELSEFPENYGDISFADGGRPALKGPTGETKGYDYNEADACEVRNGAIVWVKISDTNNPEDDWKEGTPWVKTNEGWKEADSLHVKTNTGWKESD